MLVRGRIFFQIGQRQLEERRRRLRAVLLQMDKRAGQLNQSLVERAVRPVPVREPEVFQHLVRLKKFPPVEQLEIAGVMRVELPSRNFPAIAAMRLSLLLTNDKVKSKAPSLKSKVIRAGRAFWPCF